MDDAGTRWWGAVVATSLVIALLVTPTSAQELHGNDPFGDIRGSAVPLGSSLQMAPRTISYQWPGEGCTTRTDLHVEWWVRDVTATSVHIESIHIRHRPHDPDGVLLGYRILAGDEDHQNDDLVLQGSVDHSIVVDKTIEWWPNDPPTITFRPVISSSWQPADAVGPCGGDTALLFELIPEPAIRLGGEERIGTSIATSRHLWADGAARAVTLAASEKFPDALSGSPSAVVSGGPVLLTRSDELVSSVLAEMHRVLPPGGTVRLLGGDAALSARVEAQARQEDFEVVRLAGPNRYGTAAQVALATFTAPQTIYLADGDDFPYAMIAGAAAATRSAPVVLTSQSRMPAETAAYLDRYPDAEVIAVGSAAVDAAPAATAVSGSDQYETSVALASTFDRRLVGVASGEQFPDGLTGAVHIGALGGPLLLSTSERLPPSVRAYADGAAPFEEIVLYGGTAALAPDVTLDAAGLGFLAD